MMAILLAAAASCIAVDGEKIQARDLAPAGEALAALPPDTEMGYAPAPGARRILHAAELARLIARHGSVPGNLREICIERSSEILTREKLYAALRAAVGNAQATIEVLDWSKYPVPRGDIVFSPGGRSGGREVLWRGYIRYDANRRFAIWARARIRLLARRVVARVALPAGKLIAADQLSLEEVEASPFGPQALASPDAVAGQVARRSLAAGTPILPGLLEAPQEIHTGDAVTVEVSSGLARLRLEARADAGGRRGDRIPVRNPATGKSMRARVEGAGKVSVELAGQGGK